MTRSATGPADPLDPVRAGLLRAARTDADVVLARARADADETVRMARAEAEALLERARKQGTADGTSAAARDRVRAREDAWARELVARAEVYADFCCRVRTGVRGALAEADVLRVGLEERARMLLGTGARVTATYDGGVTAEVPGRRVDLSADALADRAVQHLGAEVQKLWAP
ncbi:hypothetical protein [Streptomyces gibsoniae]|uniref:Uncharacterized protein n=1 Tax=Streptomyces gibsoniae TaxID=3075529 RepID=A0ABU2U2X6_9ACTN|nr:hypothetical protein [Streptomyces sp. DSM 41699]MDT0467412.1 hypothetical protein [Streptomyces sp. DSM 41699]